MELQVFNELLNIYYICNCAVFCRFSETSQNWRRSYSLYIPSNSLAVRTVFVPRIKLCGLL